ncbi:MAG: Hsp20/alpha crystallin family protein [Desulfobacterota bacterium]|nr:Hsp20/alpha crystallin family protein [Thermodesulfobacteriota bacterium]
MALTLWRSRKPFEALTRWFDDIDRLFNEDFFATPFERTWVPAVDVEEKDGAYIVKADLPGLKKEDIHVELQDGILTLRGERNEKHEEKKGNYYRLERCHGSFERSFRIPEGVTEKDITAKYHDGVLELKIPVPKDESKKAIPIKVE